MSKDFKELQNEWQKDKENIEHTPGIMNNILSSIKKKKNITVRFQYGNIVVLLITMLGISAFFYYVAPVKEILSRIGVGLMIGGLLIRIAIELTSVLKSKKVILVDSVLKTTEDIIAYYTYRKKIHGPVTIIILALYTIGFFMITPEFSLYFTIWQMIFIDVSYIIAACIFIPIIRKSIKREVQTLLEIIEMKEKMMNENI
ncbi:hypothetical protein [Aquimarina celericrescens]|uniref:Uncharacterized protein n=1 Tax=Aquimarina celericrescens TaxID=1964542 RepID=A0ABW5AVF3_9FLAO|nr:hypothetical protein [Aquimarina celericrescens]